MRKTVWIISLIFWVICQSSVAIAEDKNLQAIKDNYKALFQEKQYKKGLPVALKYAKAIKKKHGEKSADYSKALYNVALFHFRIGDKNKAEEALSKALSIAERISPDHEEAMYALKLLAEIAKSQGETLKAQFLKNRIVAIELSKSQSEIRGNNDSDDYIVVPVFYATDRNNTGDKDPKYLYGRKKSKDKNSGYLQYGIAKVSIPGGDNHKVGQLESPSVIKFEWSENPAKHVVLLEVEQIKKALYFKQLKQKIAGSAKQNAFIFIHGYNVTFEDAARRTAQIAYDLNFSGAPVFYSWPSRGTTLGYTSDSTAVEWTEPHLKRFLIDFLEKSNAENIYVIAHSMGNRAMSRVMASIVESHPNAARRFREIILAAPDIDAEVFKETLAPQIIENFTNITLYASSNDFALQASRLFWGHPRAGDAGDGLVVIPGIDTIDASEVDSSLLGHSYIAGSQTLLSDLIEIFRSGKRAGKREKLKQQSFNDLPYWVFE